MADMQRLGLGLQGFGAGLLGQGPQFQRGLQAMRDSEQLNQIRQQQAQAGLMQQQRLMQEQQMQMQQQRERAFYQDAAAFDRLAANDNFSGIVNLGTQRLSLLRQFPGADPSNTQEIVQLAMAAGNGDEQASALLKEMLGTYRILGEEMGVIDRPETPTSRTDLGDIQADLDAGFITPEQADALRSEATTDAPADQRERRKRELMELYGFSEPEAIENLDSVFTVDQQGNPIIYNSVTQETRYAPPTPGRGQIATGVAPDIKVEDLAWDPGIGTGPISALSGMWDATGAQLPFFDPNFERAGAAQRLLELERDAIRALAVNPERPPVIEQARIAEFIPSPQAFFENPDIARAKVANFGNLMMLQYAEDFKAYQDPTNPESVRDAARTRANQIRGVINSMLTPKAAEIAIGSVERTLAPSRFDQMTPEELLQVDIDSLQTVEEIEAFARAMRQ